MIDAHCHFWRLHHNDCTWPSPDLAVIHRDFLPEDWQREAGAVGVDGTIVVQSQPSERDTSWLLELARDDPRIVGVVGWVDLVANGAATQIAALAAHPKLRGLRPMLQDLADDDWILSPALAPAIEAMRAHDLCFDALVMPRHLPSLQRFAERHSDLRIVLDHAAKPDIERDRREPWCSSVAKLAVLPNVFCKLSGLLTEAGARCSTETLRPYVEHLLETFGNDRLLWGSDWPVLKLAGDYAGWFRMADTLTGLHGIQHAALFGGNARRVYGIHA